MVQDIYNIDASATGNIVHGRAVIKTSGKFNTQVKDVGFDDQRDIADIQSKYEDSWDTPETLLYYSNNKLLTVDGLKGYFTTNEPGRITRSGTAVTDWVDSINKFSLSQSTADSRPVMGLGGLRKGLENINFNSSNDYLIKDYTPDAAPEYSDWLPNANEAAMYITVFMHQGFNQGNNVVWSLGGGHREPGQSGFRGLGLSYKNMGKKLIFAGRNDSNSKKENKIPNIDDYQDEIIVHIGVRHLGDTKLYQWANGERSDSGQVPTVAAGDNFKYGTTRGGLCIGSVLKDTQSSNSTYMKFAIFAAYVRDYDFTIKEINKLGKWLTKIYGISWREITDISATE